jgi:hypothetical protein
LDFPAKADARRIVFAPKTQRLAMKCKCQGKDNEARSAIQLKDLHRPQKVFEESSAWRVRFAQKNPLRG